MDKIVKCADDTDLQISIEKTKAVKTLQTPPDQDWIKGTKIEPVGKHKILGLIFDTRMNWSKHILSTKAKAEKKLTSLNA
jgi:hypothetical protein